MSPLDEYTSRLRAQETRLGSLQTTHTRLGTLRLVIFTAFALTTWGALAWHAYTRLWILIPALIFVATALYHGGVKRLQLQVERVIAFYHRGVARIEDRWIGQGSSGDRFADPHHVYTADLDVFGRGGLFQLLCTARTRMGENTLATWLASPASIEDILSRQSCVSELRDKLDLREALATAGEDREVAVQPDALRAWSRTPNSLTSRWIAWAAAVLPIMMIAAAIIWKISDVLSQLLVILLIEAAMVGRLRKALDEILYSTENAFEDLKLLAALLTRLERESFKAPALQALIKTLESQGVSAAQAISRLATLVQLIESRRNPLLAVLQVPLLYPIHVARAAERWRAKHGHAVSAWLEALGTIEALVSIAAYSHEHPADPFPQFIAGSASFAGESMGHPLIPALQCVRNSVQIKNAIRVLLISGSNMSGKSTLLRTVGVNTILAMAGAPVRAERLQLTALQIGASIRINDSLHEGSSRFYAEITRLRQLNELSGREPPLLFLLDEILQGTNSKDRHIGAQGVLRSFLDAGAIGLISTHDLALTDIDGATSERLRNLHFQDEIENGQLRFDFRLREGTVERSNGIELMRSIGLKV